MREASSAVKTTFRVILGLYSYLVDGFIFLRVPTLLRTVTSSSRGMMTSSFMTASSRLQVTSIINMLFNKINWKKLQAKYVTVEKNDKN